jgi:hypothetical protein
LRELRRDHRRPAARSPESNLTVAAPPTCIP